MDVFESLTASYFDGRLTETEARIVADVLDSDAEKATRFVGEYEIDRLLALRGIPADESRVDAILAQIQGEADPFVQSVFRRIERETLVPKKGMEFWRVWIKQLFWRPGLVLPVAACVGVLCCAWIFHFSITAGEPRLELAGNSSVVVIRNNISTRAQRGFAFRAGDVLRVGTNSAMISFAPEKTRLTNGLGTELKLVSVSGAKRFILNAGKMEASVARQRAFKSMIIVTPQAETRILGTRFSLAVDTNETCLEVTEGTVKFTRVSDGKSVKVGAGNHSVAAANSELSVLPETGRILREYWTNLSNNSLTSAGSSLKSKRSLVAQPEGFDYLARFESIRLAPGVRFTERIRGYVHPPKTGLYRFALTTVHVETVLHLSRTDRPEDVTQVAFRAPDGVGTSLQEVTPVPLQAGRKYYVEVVHESDGGDDQLAVSWQAPGGEPEIIPGKFLSPFPVKEKKGQR